MSQTKNRGAAWVGWIISALLIAISAGLWTQKQNIVDALQYRSYEPTAAIAQVSSEAGFTKDAEFTFFATHPAIQSGKQFNQYCVRQEADSPILGCYASNRIYIFDITDSRLDGIKVVTAAHELLHAEFDRLPDSEKRRLEPLLQAAYEQYADDELEARMRYYEKTEPGQSINELHSIVGTEFPSITPELERYYERYFKDRKSLVSVHQKVDQTFDSLKQEARDLVQQIETLVDKINTESESYNTQASALDAAVADFNARAERPGGFTTQSDFQAARLVLVRRSDQLSAFRQQIQSDITRYNLLLSKLESINTEAASLNKSLDSTLSDVPTI